MSSRIWRIALASFLLVAIAGGQWSSGGSIGFSSAGEETCSGRILDWITIKNYSPNKNPVDFVRGDVGHNWVEIYSPPGMSMAEESYGWFGDFPGFSGGTVNTEDNPTRDRNHGRNPTNYPYDPTRYSEYHPVLTRDLTDRQVLNKIHEFVESQRTDRGTYNIIFNNCGHFQKDLMEYVGLEKPSESSTGFPSNEESSGDEGSPPRLPSWQEIGTMDERSDYPSQDRVPSDWLNSVTAWFSAWKNLSLNIDSLLSTAGIVLVLIIGIRLVWENLGAFIVNGVLGLAVLYLSSTHLGIWVNVNTMTLLVCAIGGIPGAVLLIVLQYFYGISF